MKKVMIIISAVVLLLIAAALLYIRYVRNSSMDGPGMVNEPISGGVTDESYNAPKEIESTELVSLETRFYVYDTENEKLEGWYTFKVSKDESGEATLIIGSENPGNSAGNAESGDVGTGDVESGDVVSGNASGAEVSVSVPAEILDNAQKIIETHELVKYNGIVKQTAGLPPEYAPCYLDAQYASGEKLYFKKNNDPWAEWALEMRDLLMAQE